MIKDIFSIKGKIFVITGGLGQLGKVYIDAILSNNGKVVVLDVKSENDKLVLDLIKKIKSKDFIYIQGDVTLKKDIKTALIKIIKKWGKVDVLINNAALDSPPNAPKSEVGLFEEYPESSFDKVMEVNVKGTFLSCQVFGKNMSKNKSGVIINIASIYGMVSPRQDIYNFRRTGDNVFYKPAPYSISKSAIYNFTRYLATYWAKDNVRVNTLTLAGIYNNQKQEFLDAYCKNMPIDRMANEEEAVGPMLFLASDASSYMTGSNLVIDGGWTAW